MSTIGNLGSASTLTAVRSLVSADAKSATPAKVGIGTGNNPSAIATWDLKSGTPVAIPLTAEEQAMVDKMQAISLQNQEKETEQLARMRVNMQSKQVSSIFQSQDESA